MRFDGADLTGWTTNRTPTDVAAIRARAEHDRPRLLRPPVPGRPLVAAHDHPPPSGASRGTAVHGRRPDRPAAVPCRVCISAPPPTAAPRRLARPRHAGSPTPPAPAAARPVRLTGQLHTVEKATGRILDTRHTTTVDARRGDLRALRRPPRLGLPALRRDLPGRHLPAHPRRPRRRQRRPDLRRHPPGRVRHPHRALLRARPHPTVNREDREGRALPDAPRPRRCPHGKRPDLHRPAHREHPSLGGRCAWTATTTPTTSSGTAGPANSGAAPRSPSADRSAPLERAHGVKLRVSYGKVAEYQRRGVVHFHALIRLDGIDPRPTRMRYSPHPTDSGPPTWASSSPTPSPPPGSGPPDYPTPPTPGPSTGAPARHPPPPGCRIDGGQMSAPRPSPPTWPSTPPRPPNPPACRSPAG